MSTALDKALKSLTQFGERFGFPALVTVIVLWLLTQGVWALQTTLDSHDAHSSQLLHALCLNLAETPAEVARCEVTP